MEEEAGLVDLEAAEAAVVQRPPGAVTATERRRSQYAEGVLRRGPLNGERRPLLLSQKAAPAAQAGDRGAPVREP